MHRSNRLRLVSYAATMLFWHGTALAVVDLGTLGTPDTYSQALGINESGQVVGVSEVFDGENYNPRAFLYSAGLMTDIGTLGGASATAFGINNAGQIVGTSLTATSTVHSHAFLYSSGVMTDIHPPGAVESTAYAINATGQVVGIYRSGGMPFGFLYESGAYTTLDGFGPPYFGAEAFAINSSGQVGGQAPIPEGWGGFLYDDGAMTAIGFAEGGQSRIAGINDAGEVVGDGPNGAILFSGGEIIDLSVPGGLAQDINSHSEIVGVDFGTNQGFVYRNGLATIFGSPLGGTDLFLTSINDAGQIAGYAQLPSGVFRAVLLDLCNNDGILDPAEQCDDGNADDGDGCDARCGIETCYTCSGEPSTCSVATGAACDDGVFCNGADTCDASAACLHDGDPCPGTSCNTCQEDSDTCFDPFGTSCSSGACGLQGCDGAGTCETLTLCEGPLGAATCSDSSDNDSDSSIDSADTDCHAFHEGPPGDPSCTNGLDDDSDGASDAADRGCQASPPELCNGFDDDGDLSIDEGFADSDSDLLADCIDLDQDNDSVADRIDNCPSVSNIAQADADADGMGDACDSGERATLRYPSTRHVTVDGQYEPEDGEWSDVAPVSFLDGASHVLTGLDVDRDRMFVMFDFSLSTERLAVGDEVGPISFQSNGNVFDVFIVQGGPDTDFAPNPAMSSGGTGDTVRVLLNGLPFDNSNGCIAGAVDFNTTSPSFATGHNLVELSVHLASHGGCYDPDLVAWSATLPGVAVGPLPRSKRSGGSSSNIAVYEAAVSINPLGSATVHAVGSDPVPTGQFRCYVGKDEKAPKFLARAATLTDELGTRSTSVVKPTSACGVVDDGTGEADQSANLACYAIKDSKLPAKFTGATVQVSNSFGTLNLKLKKAVSLCEASLFNQLQSSLELNNFKCYQASDLKTPAFTPTEVSASDRFGPFTTTALSPAQVCLPADTGSGIVEKDSELVCYKSKDQAKFTPQSVAVANDLGVVSLSLKKPTMLCVPSTVTFLP